MFNTVNNELTRGISNNTNFGHLITLNGILEGNYLDEPVTIKRWARTRRQKILEEISFESEVHNIYDPRFSSDES